MKAKHIIFLIIALISLAAVLWSVMYVMSTIRDEIDITDTAKTVFADFKSKAVKGEISALNSKEEKMVEHWTDVEHICFESMDSIVTDYARSSINYNCAISAIQYYSLFPVSASELESYNSKIDKIENGRIAFDTAKAETDSLIAALLYTKVDINDDSYYTEAKKNLKEILDIDLLKKHTFMMLSKNSVDSTIDNLKAINDMLDSNREVQSLLTYAENYKVEQETVTAYKGPIEVLTVRNLMAFPELVYSENSSYTDSYDASLITPTEFKNILTQLYENDYILVSINSFNAENINKIEIPSNKKPFVLIVEDLTYPKANLGSGVNGRLAVDENGELCTVSGTTVSYDNESILILESFLNERPDFTYKGARGCISLTGYNGIFGYDIETENEKKDAQNVANLLIEQGWTFASQSYSYTNIQNSTLEKLKWDTEKWNELIAPIVGKAEVYVWPYGSHVRSGEKHTYLYGQGYNIFLGLGITPYRAIEPDGNGVFFDRRSLTGYALQTYKDEYSHLFNAEEVIDIIRPKKEQDD